MHHFLNVSFSDSSKSSIAFSGESDQEVIESCSWWLGENLPAESVVSAFLYRSSGRGVTEELIGNFQFDHEDGKFVFLPA